MRFLIRSPQEPWEEAGRRSPISQVGKLRANKGKWLVKFWGCRICENRDNINHLPALCIGYATTPTIFLNLQQKELLAECEVGTGLPGLALSEEEREEGYTKSRQLELEVIRTL